MQYFELLSKLLLTEYSCQLNIQQRNINSGLQPYTESYLSAKLERDDGDNYWKVVVDSAATLIRNL